MNCLFCGQPLIPGESQCRSCGRFINAYQQGQAAQPTGQPAGQATYNQQPVRPAQTPVQPTYNRQASQTPVQPTYNQQAAQTPAQPAQQAARPVVTPQQPAGQQAPFRPQAGPAVQLQRPTGPAVTPQQAARPAMTYNQQAPGAAARPAAAPRPAQGAQPPSGGGKGKGKLIAIISAIAVLIAGGVLAVVLLTKDKDKEDSSTRVGKNDRTTAATTVVTTELSTDTPTTADVTTEATTEATTSATTETTTELTTEATTTQQAGGSKTVMMYIIGSDLETKWGEATMDIQEILDANLSSNVNYIIQTGGAKDWQNDLMIDGECQRFQVQGKNLVELQKLGKVNMSDYNSLTDFINYCKSSYPADTYMLVLWDHGGGIPISYGLDEIFPNYMMSAAEIGMGIANSGVHFESLLFDACNVCTLEVAMSVYKNVDYMVAAESYVNGTGYYYTDWLKMYDSCRIGDMDYTEQICRDYMKTIHEYDMTGSISVLEMDKIAEVYDAYRNYINALNKTVIEENDYVGYTQARNNCIAYENTDTIDIVTLASQYQNDYSTKLINSIVNCVSFTDSDFAPGHGMAVYSPFEFIEYYSYAREMMSVLGYDQEILGFYDSYCSLRATYQGGTTTSEASEDWYDDETVNDTVDPDYKPQQYTLSTTQNSQGQTIVEVSDELWQTAETIEMGVILMSADGNQGLMLGTDYDAYYDDDDNLMVSKPESWAYVNGNAASYVCIEEYQNPENDKEWYMYGTIFAKVNGANALILVYYSNDNPSGTVQGYANVDYDNLSAVTDFYQFQDTDTIDLVYPIFDANGTSSYVANESPFTYADMKLTYEEIDLSGYTTVVWYTITDVYGNKYETEGDYVE